MSKDNQQYLRWRFWLDVLLILIVSGSAVWLMVFALTQAPVVALATFISLLLFKTLEEVPGTFSQNT